MTPIQTPQFDLTHTLLPIYNDLKVFPTLKALKQSPLYAQHGPEIERVSNGVAWQNHVHDPGLRDAIRVVAWNIERGLCLDGILHVLQTNNVLNQADILLITETDIGMGRSGNRNVPLELAEALNLNYCFANSFLSLEKGDVGEQDHDLPNTLALHGITILSRFKIDASQVLSLPPAKDLFTDLEKRLGTRKALICRIAINNQPYDFAVIHLELASTPRQRAGQMEPLLQALQTSNAKAQLIGGDWNTTTYNLVNKRGLAKNLLHKAIRVQFSGAIAHYMTPERIFERPLFDLLKAHGYAVDPYNDRNTGTVYYDIYDKNVNDKMRAYISKVGVRWLHKKLRPWNGCVPLHLDWFTGKNIQPVQSPQGIYAPPQTIERPTWQNQTLSDHDPIVVDLHLT